MKFGYDSLLWWARDTPLYTFNRMSSCLYGSKTVGYNMPCGDFRLPWSGRENANSRRWSMNRLSCVFCVLSNISYVWQMFTKRKIEECQNTASDILIYSSEWSATWFANICSQCPMRNNWLWSEALYLERTRRELTDQVSNTDGHRTRSGSTQYCSTLSW